MRFLKTLSLHTIMHLKHVMYQKSHDKILIFNIIKTIIYPLIKHLEVFQIKTIIGGKHGCMRYDQAEPFPFEPDVPETINHKL